MTSDNISANNNPQSENRNSKENAFHPQAEILPASTELESPPAASHCEQPHDQKKHWLDYVTFGLELLGLVVLCVYAAYTIKIYRANKTSADAAKSAADTAKDALHISERAYVSVGSLQLDTAKSLISVAIANSGHIPSGKVEIVSYEVTFNPDKPLQGGTSFKYIVERHKGITHFTSISPGIPPLVGMIVPVPQMSTKLLNSGMQKIMVVGMISYNDGFPDSPLQRSAICNATVYHLVAKTVYLTPCDAAVELPNFEALDWTGLTQEY